MYGYSFPTAAVGRLFVTHHQLVLHYLTTILQTSQPTDLQVHGKEMMTEGKRHWMVEEQQVCMSRWTGEA